MKKLTYKKVFSKYNMTFSDRINRLSYNLYKTIKTSRFSTLSEEEKSELTDPFLLEDNSTAMPNGYNYSTQQIEEGYLNLEYLDFFDFLPKEHKDKFKSRLKRCIGRNRLSFFSHYFTKEDDIRIDEIGEYNDFLSHSKLCGIELCNNAYLQRYASTVSISLCNVSTSFMLVKYRFHISDEFKIKLNSICKRNYTPYFDVEGAVDANWYQPQRFARSLHTGDDARAKELYTLISNLKWQAFLELRRSFSINFETIHLFPPTFETYSTNIRPSKLLENRKFWQSIGIIFHTDYSPKFNICVSFDNEQQPFEGAHYSAYYGGAYMPESNQYNDLFQYQYYISDIYAVYLVASSMNYMTNRTIAQGNKQMSKSIIKAKAATVLRVRANVEQDLYYTYRFISEFTGNTIDLSDVKAFGSPLYKNSSETEWRLKSISKTTQNTKNTIDALFKILNDAAEYGNAKLNLGIQCTMILLSVLSLLIAILSLMNFNTDSLKILWEFIVSHLNAI